MKSVRAYKREKKMYLNPMSKTTMGLWIGTSPRIVFDETEPPSIKGKYVREVLKHSQEGVPHPTDWDSFLNTFLKEVGVKSWSKFAKTALSCTIDLKGDRLEFLPWRNSGPKDNYAFVPSEDRKVTISIDASDEELGLLLERAFEACE
ncbi:MAG: contact-dependent growth inhibition system immunity protein [Thermodesulfobacteriota bacterium]